MVTKAGRWWSKDVELDIVAANEDKSALISAECKFHNSPVNDSDLARHLAKKLDALPRADGAEVFYWYFSWGG